MNRRNKITLTCTLTCTLAALTVLGLTSTRAQTPPGGDMGYGGEGMYGGEYMDEGGYGMAGGESYGEYGGGYGMGGPGTEPPGARELKARLGPLLPRLRDAADDQQKEAIKDQLSSILEDYFQRDLQRRANEIDAIEQRVQRLRE
jgi:hypothetical protein